jgi:hypothetical protein
MLAATRTGSMKKVRKGAMPANDSAEAIVEREFELRHDGGESKVFARIRRPSPVGESEFRCELEIEGLGDRIATRTPGIDAVQAYELALQSVALSLYSSPAYQSGRLTFEGSFDLRLPIPDCYRCLVRTDLERERVVRQLAGTDEDSERFSQARLARLQDAKVCPDQPQDAPVILERVFDLRRGRNRTDVRVFFRKPVPHRLGHWCGFKIEGLLKKPPARTRMLGEDSIEALRNAMKLAMVNIVSSSAYQRGQLSWLGMYDLGMPIHEDVEPLIRKDLHARAMAEHWMNPPLARRNSR